MFIDRYISHNLLDQFKESNKILILYGARQVGKTTLLKKIIAQLNLKILSISADERQYIDVFASQNFTLMKQLVAGYEVLFLDEAQRIPEIGLNLKILHDNMPELKIIVTGSSSFELANKIKEPLTGRTWTFKLYPISYLELSNIYNDYELNQQLESLMLYGAYPDIFSLKNVNEKRKYLEELSSSYLYKDILELEKIKYSNKLYNLLRLLAYQIGSQVSTTELATSLSISKDTVDHYIDLLEKSFVIFRLPGFSRNLRKEVTKMDKIYFYDLGVRNSILGNFDPLSIRNDVGGLWENFLIVERKKYLSYKNEFSRTYFWRTYTGAELDYIEENGDNLAAFEFKFNNLIAKVPKTWAENYSNSHFKTVNKENYLEFLK